MSKDVKLNNRGLDTEIQHLPGPRGSVAATGNAPVVAALGFPRFGGSIKLMGPRSVGFVGIWIAMFQCWR